MTLARFSIDESPHTMDGLLIHAFDGFHEVEAFISRKVMDIWARQDEHPEERRSLYREQYNAIGKINLIAIARIVAAKYARGVAFSRQHPFVDVLTLDISESGARLDLKSLMRTSFPPSFVKVE
jgi:hypothetical protein